MKCRNLVAGVTFATAVFTSFQVLAVNQMPGVYPGPGNQYATSAFPGFDAEPEDVKPSKKTPRWFSWINGPKMTNAVEQLAWCRTCLQNESWRAARRGLDALVREWPTSPEAPIAQRMLAELLLEKYDDLEGGFEAYRYLLDFFSSQCDYDDVVNRLYQVAQFMRRDGKTILFFRFKNTVDVRRAYESVVLRAPGAKFVPEAMLAIGEMREDEGKYKIAVTVYENLRNLHPDAPEAKIAIRREAADRMILLKDHAYNRNRALDTVAFLKLALTSCDKDDLDQLQTWLNEARGHLEDEAFRGAKFYDGPTRTRRSAESAYERFLAEYPLGKHADEARARLEELKAADAASPRSGPASVKGE